MSHALIEVSQCLKELTSLVETAHLLRSPRNVQRLLAALRRAGRGKRKPESLSKLRREMGLGRYWTVNGDANGP